MVEKSDLPPYPLAQVLQVKRKRVEDAEAVVKQKQKLLDIEIEKLEKAKAEREKVKQHYSDKLKQMRDEMDKGTTSDKIDQMKIYLKVCQEKLKIEDKKVKEQQNQVDIAEKNVEIAKNVLKEKQREEDKILTHRTEWEKTTMKELDIEQTRAEDDLGSTMFLSKYMQAKAEKRSKKK